ncbi:MAG: hypothetical protein CVT73_03645 [Alphaproteobacteria bacterium HGW-Alphaproteobacteria-12]|nr:MAG: hypothetical protein CVT73_03645 [Alphaproteobacteria bacterium HGW-Alphaproteobacteria-12]
MWQRAYLHRLKRDLDLWIERGWVTAANADAIIRAAGEPVTSERRMPAILAILGVVLIGFAAMSFVAANWTDISKLVKLIMIFGAMWGAYGAAYFLQRRGSLIFAQAAILAGLLLFGAGIMLIAQIYHIATDDPGGVLAWCVASLVTAWLLASRPALALAILLAVVWTIFTISLGHGTPHWAFWLPWAAAMALSLRLAWLPGFHLSLLAAIIWHAANADMFDRIAGVAGGHVLTVFTLEGVAVWLAALLFSDRAARFATAAEQYGIALSFTLFWFLQAMPRSADEGAVFTAWAIIAAASAATLLPLGALNLRRGFLNRRHAAGIAVLALATLAWIPIGASAPGLLPWVYAAAFLALAAWLVSYGTARGSRFAVNFGFAAFTAEVLYLYFETLNTLLDTALFFALGGVLLIAGSILAERMRRRLVKTAASGGDA